MMRKWIDYCSKEHYNFLLVIVICVLYATFDIPLLDIFLSTLSITTEDELKKELSISKHSLSPV